MFTANEETKAKVKELIDEKGGFENFLKYYSSDEVTLKEKESLENILFFNGIFSIIAAIYYAS